MIHIDTLGQQAKVWCQVLSINSNKNDLLNQVAKALVAESAYGIAENAKDSMPRKMFPGYARSLALNGRCRDC